MRSSGLIKANNFWHQLREAGVGIETIREGKLDFATLGGWLTASIQQHAKMESVKSLAIDVERGQRRQSGRGYWMQPTPYGYRKPPGSETQLALAGPAQSQEAAVSQGDCRRHWKLDEVLRSGNQTRIKHALSQIIERFEIKYGVQPQTRHAKGLRVSHRTVSGALRFSNSVHTAWMTL